MSVHSGKSNARDWFVLLQRASSICSPARAKWSSIRRLRAVWEHHNISARPPADLTHATGSSPSITIDHILLIAYVEKIQGSCCQNFELYDVQMQRAIFVHMCIWEVISPFIWKRWERNQILLVPPRQPTKRTHGTNVCHFYLQPNTRTGPTHSSGMKPWHSMSLLLKPNTPLGNPQRMSSNVHGHVRTCREQPVERRPSNANPKKENSCSLPPFSLRQISSINNNS